MPERVPAEIDAKKAAFDTFMSSGAAFVLKQIASIPIAQFYLPRTPENEPKLITDEAFRDYWSGNLSPQGQAPATAVGIATKKRFFHWFLEFPEIIQRGGFDCILGNPPYLGGQALSGTYGHEFCNYVKVAYAPTGLSELVVFFLRRIFTLLRPGGFTAFITTNSIKDGDIRKDGLEQVVSHGGSINFAIRGVKWPGRANLVVSLVGLHKGVWAGAHVLDGRRVPVINAFLDDTQPTADPKGLSENNARLFQGSIFLGDGFLLTHAEADRFLLDDARNKEVLFYLLNGQELNNEPAQIPTRSIVNFADMDRDAASRYRGPFSRIEELVKPVRANDKRATRRDRWWQYAERAAGLYSSIRQSKQCFVAAGTTKHLNFSRCPTNFVFSHALYVLTSERWDHYSVVQSSLHEGWARKYSGALETRLRYSPSDCFATFAFPEGLSQTPSAGLAEIGERYHEHRRKLMLSLWLGLTDVYNLFHSREVEGDLAKHFASRAKKDPRGELIPEEHRAGAVSFTPEQALAGILELRRLHVELDVCVRDAYGWHDLPLEHDFHEVETLPENDRVRYTISAAARKELLKRLLAENHRRAATESAASPEPPKRSRRRAGNGGRTAQWDLFK